MRAADGLLAAGARLAARAPWAWATIRNLAPFAVLLAVWQLAAAVGWLPRAFLPPPTALPGAAADLVENGSLLPQIGETLLRVLGGGAVGLSLGVTAAVVLAMLPRVWGALQDVINYLQAVGEIGWLPLFILWAGFNERTVVLTIGYTVFFPIFFGTLSGFRAVPPNLANSVRTLGASRWDVIREVLLPGALPAMITGLRAGMGFAWRTVILAEMLVAQSGLGVMLFNARTFFRVDYILVGMVVAGVLWLATDKLVLQPLEARTIQRWGILRRA